MAIVELEISFKHRQQIKPFISYVYNEYLAIFNSGYARTSVTYTHVALYISVYHWLANSNTRLTSVYQHNTRVTVTLCKITYYCCARLHIIVVQDYI